MQIIANQHHCRLGHASFKPVLGWQHLLQPKLSPLFPTDTAHGLLERGTRFHGLNTAQWVTSCLTQNPGSVEYPPVKPVSKTCLPSMGNDFEVSANAPQAFQVRTHEDLSTIILREEVWDEPSPSWRRDSSCLELNSSRSRAGRIAEE